MEQDALRVEIPGARGGGSQGTGIGVHQGMEKFSVVFTVEIKHMSG